MSNRLKLIHLFAGVGSPEMALKRLGIPFEIVGYSEIDKYAIESYKAIHGDVPFLGDVTKIERLPKCNMLFFGFCCQDISVAGKQKGLLDELGNKTRSGLLFDVLRLIKLAKDNDESPEILIAENVKNLVGKKFKNDFDNLLLVLDSLGYNSYWQVLNAKDYEVPQNRERVFIVSIRKDVDKRGYTFPEKMQLKKCIKDILEENPDPKLYLSDDKVARFIKNFDFNRNKKSDEIDVVGSTKPEDYKIGSRERVYNSENIMACITATDYKQPKQVMVKKNPICLGNASIDIDSQAGKCYSVAGLSPTLCAGTHGYAMGNIVEYQIGASRGRNPENPSDRTVGAPTEQRLEVNSQGISNCLTTVSKDNPQRGRIYDPSGCSPTLNCMQGGGLEPKIVEGNIERYDIPEIVKVRKFEVNIEKLQAVLKEHKNQSNKEISERLGISQTKVEHWFRQDKYFAIPDAEYWYQLKELLKIETNEFDESIMTFEEREGVYDKSNRCYGDMGISPTLTATSADERIIETPQIRIRKLSPRECWRLMDFSDEDFDKAKAVGISNSQLYKQAGNSIVVACLYHIFRKLFIDFNEVKKDEQT